MAATTQPLKLLARDDEDLRIVAGFLQDAIVPVAEMCFLGEEKRFAMVVSRFRWETAPEEGGAEAAPAAGGDASFDGGADNGPGGGAPVAAYERIHCGVCFDGIGAVRMRGFDLRDRSLMLNLLTMEARDGAVLLHFSGGACIRLEGRPEGDGWTCRMKDIGEPWPTLRRPRHPDAEAAAQGRP